MNKATSLIGGVIVLLIGIFYALFPHSIHISSGFAFGLSHGIHVTLGVVLLVIGSILLWKRRK